MNKEINDLILGRIVKAVTILMVVALSYSLYLSGLGVSFANEYENGWSSTNESTLESSSDETISEIESTKVEFSLTGVHARTFIISNLELSEKVEWKYSLNAELGDNATWTTGAGLNYTLTEEEFNTIKEGSRLIVRVIDKVAQDERDFKFDITKGVVPQNLYANDIENIIIPLCDGLEWRAKDSDVWHVLNENVAFTGEQIVYVRTSINKLELPSDEVAFTFTNDVVDEHNKYVSREFMSVVSASSSDGDNGYYSTNVLDGNAKSVWRTVNGDNERAIVLSIKPSYISSIEYVPSITPMNGRAKDVTIYTSMDGINFKETAKATNLADDSNVKTIRFDATPAAYIKFVINASHGDGLSAHVAMLNVYEDNTKRTKPTASVTYDVIELTNGDVVAHLVNPSEDIEVISDGGFYHTFTENGKFTFKYKNVIGIEGTTTATVDWIDKTVPTASIVYSTTSTTRYYVTATLTNESEQIEILNNGGSRNIIFNENGTFEFQYRDLAGNVGRTTATVTWIDKSYVASTSKPTTPSKKPTSTTSNNNNNNNSNSNNDNEDKDEEPKPSETKTTSESFTVNNVTIKLLESEISKKYSLKMDNKTMSKTLQAKTGKDSSYFELYFVNADGKKTTVDQKMKITIRLDGEKDFKGVYQVLENDKVKKLESKVVGSNKVEFEVESLSSYIISYEAKSKDTEGSSFTADYIIALVLAVILVIAAIRVYKKTKNN